MAFCKCGERRCNLRINIAVNDGDIRYWEQTLRDRHYPNETQVLDDTALRHVRERLEVSKLSRARYVRELEDADRTHERAKQVKRALLKTQAQPAGNP